MAKKDSSGAPSSTASARKGDAGKPSKQAPPTHAGKGKGKGGEAAPSNKPVVQAPDTREIIKSIGVRLGLPLVAVWLVAAFVNRAWGYGLAAALTLAAGGLVYWAWSRLDRSRKVAEILQSVEPTDREGRKEALSKIEQNFKKGDVAATFAKAQLLMQDSPDQALAELESIDLTKCLPAEADQARVQRAVVHLTKGEVDRARGLVDPIDLSRHEDTKVRAMMASVVAEAWARTGQAKKGRELLDLYKIDDPALADLVPQLARARAFAAAALNDTKAMRAAVRRLASINPQYLAVFMGRRVHPLLQKEARDTLVQSGVIQRPRPQYARR